MTALSFARRLMEIETEYAVRLFFPNPTFAQIYFEAVANALDANATDITINISTHAQINPEHLEITVSDNGEGFTNDRFDRFYRLTKPVDVYHKGLGRLVYLHYFSRVHVISVFDGKKRQFTFSKAFKGKAEPADKSASDKPGTLLRFSGFLGGRLRTYDDVTPTAIKEKLLEHFLPYFDTRKKAHGHFRITIRLETKGADSQRPLIPETQFITEADIPDFQSRVIEDESLGAFDKILMRYRIEKDTNHRLQLTAVSIDGRTLPINLLPPNAIPFNSSAIFLFESDLFSGKSDSARQRLILPESISEASLFRLLRREMSAILNENLDEIQQKNAVTKTLFEDKYPHLAGYFEQETVGIIDKDEAIAFAQTRFFKEQRQVLEGNSLDDATFEKSLEISSRTLTEYVLYRELVIERLRQVRSDDHESVIHNLIAPKGERFHGEELLDGIYRNNAWLLDDKFMSFRTLLSERTMKELIAAITLSDDVVNAKGRPDISLIFSADPSGGDKVEVVILEVKPRRIDHKENTYASVQLVQRAQKLATYCPNIQRVWYFGVVHFDEELSDLLQSMGWTPLFSKGQAFYADFKVKRPDGSLVPTPTCLLSYDAIIEDAANRNHTFLEILKNDIRKAQAKSNGQLS